MTPSRPRGAPRGLDGVIGPYTDDFIADFAIEHIRNKPRSNPLNRVRAFRAARQNRRCVRLDGHAAKGRLAPLYRLAPPRNSAPGPNARDQNVRLAVGIVPDLLGRGAAVYGGVGRIPELLRHQVAGVGRD